jgi:hypothetical protein
MARSNPGVGSRCVRGYSGPSMVFVRDVAIAGSDVAIAGTPLMIECPECLILKNETK